MLPVIVVVALLCCPFVQGIDIKSYNVAFETVGTITNRVSEADIVLLIEPHSLNINLTFERTMRQLEFCGPASVQVSEGKCGGQFEFDDIRCALCLTWNHLVSHILTNQTKKRSLVELASKAIDGLIDSNPWQIPEVRSVVDRMLPAVLENGQALESIGDQFVGIIKISERQTMRMIEISNALNDFLNSTYWKMRRDKHQNLTNDADVNPQTAFSIQMSNLLVYHFEKFQGELQMSKEFTNQIRSQRYGLTADVIDHVQFMDRLRALGKLAQTKHSVNLTFGKNFSQVSAAAEVTALNAVDSKLAAIALKCQGFENNSIAQLVKATPYPFPYLDSESEIRFKQLYLPHNYFTVIPDAKQYQHVKENALEKLAPGTFLNTLPSVEFVSHNQTPDCISGLLFGAQNDSTTDLCLTPMREVKKPDSLYNLGRGLWLFTGSNGKLIQKCNLNTQTATESVVLDKNDAAVFFQPRCHCTYYLDSKRMRLPNPGLNCNSDQLKVFTVQPKLDINEIVTRIMQIFGNFSDQVHDLHLENSGLDATALIEATLKKQKLDYVGKTFAQLFNEIVSQHQPVVIGKPVLSISEKILYWAFQVTVVVALISIAVLFYKHSQLSKRVEFFISRISRALRPSHNLEMYTVPTKQSQLYPSLLN